jgi:uncharacterized protein
MRTKLTLSLAFLLSLQLWAQNIPEKPSPARFVNDFAGLLSASESSSLEQKLDNYQDTTSTQMVIVTVSSLDNYDVESYSYTLAKNWGIGQKGKNNGILILVAPNEHKMRIEVGYGLEGAIPDAVCKQIIREVMKPYFKQNNYYQGLNEATTYLIKYASGEYKADPNADGNNSGAIWLIVFIIIIVLISFISKYKQAKNSHMSSHLDFWTILALMNMSNRGGGRGFGGGSSGGGGSSWDFGGGGFGGGGASGDW